jgi:molecular chaperone DnaK (HSP70)
MITKGTHLPTMGTHLFKTVEDGQDYAAVRIFEGEETSQTSSSDAPYREIGHVLIPLPKNAKKGYKVRCTVTMKGDGFLYFNAEGEDGKILPATFKTSN